MEPRPRPRPAPHMSPGCQSLAASSQSQSQLWILHQSQWSQCQPVPCQQLGHQCARAIGVAWSRHQACAETTSARPTSASAQCICVPKSMALCWRDWRRPICPVCAQTNALLSNVILHDLSEGCICTVSRTGASGCLSEWSQKGATGPMVSEISMAEIWDAMCIIPLTPVAASPP